jgi:hypothetical protein
LNSGGKNFYRKEYMNIYDDNPEYKKTSIIDSCKRCGRELHSTNDYYVIHRIVIAAKNDIVHYVGINEFLDKLSDYLITTEIVDAVGKKRALCCHLSASQILLLRPDIVKEFIQTTLKENIELFFIQDTEICLDCYEEYKKNVPLV